jgi:phosphonate transport system substrate-binding protein
MSSGIQTARHPAKKHTVLGAFMGLTLGAVLSAMPSHADIKLIFGTYAADKPTEVVRQFKPFLDALSVSMTDIMGEPVTIKMQIAREYQAGIDALVNGDVDFSRFGPASYVTAKSANAGVEIVVMESKKGKKTSKGIIAIHSDSDITSVAELANHSFAFGDPLSTIGRYLSQSLLLNAGISSKDLSGHDFLGRHDRVGAAVGKGDFDAGALKSSTFKKLQAKNIPIKALAEFDNITKPWITRPNVDAKILNAMRKAMLEMTDPDALKTISKSGFLEGSDADYETIRNAISHSKNF